MMKFFKNIFARNTDDKKASQSASQEPSKNTDEFYSSDTPKNTPDLDEFRRKNFSERIAHTIAARRDPESLVVAIYGRWGEGKTTVLNFINIELSHCENVVPLKFNPWLFPSETELLLAFYTELAKGLRKSLPTRKETIGKLITDYIVPFANLSKLVPVINGFELGDSAEKIGKMLSNVRLEELRDRIGEFLIEQKKLVVVFLDDIDRLDRTEIYAIFRLIKLSANFENIVYVLAFDQEIVEDALSERYFSKKQITGQNFLEKIVQVPIDLPKIPITDLRKFCYQQIYKALEINEIEFSDSDWQEFSRGFIAGIEIRLETPRMAVRYGNMLTFSMPLVKGEVNIVEFLLIEAVRAFYPRAYKIVRENREAFTAPGLGGMSAYQPEKAEFKRIVDTTFIELNEDETNNLKRLLTILFPRLKTIYENTIYGPEWDKTWAKQKRIASDKYFDRYFTYSIPLGDVSDTQVENFIEALDRITPEDLAQILAAELTEENAEVFISKLQQKTERISPTGQVKLATSLSVLAYKLPNPKELFSFRTPFSRGALLVAYLIEAQATDDDKYKLAVQVMNIADPITFAFEVVKWLRTKKSTNEVNALSPDKLSKVCSILAEKIENTFNQNINVFEKFPDHASNFLWFWGKFGTKASADKYLTNFLSVDVQNIHKLLNSVVPIAYPMDGSLPHKSDFERDQYSYLQSFVDLNILYELLKKTYGDKLESKEYPYDSGEPLDLRIAKQFAWIHEKVLNEKDMPKDDNVIE